MCLICDERPVSTAFVPCGHATYCSVRSHTRIYSYTTCAYNHSKYLLVWPLTRKLQTCVQNPANFGPHRALACPQCNESAPVAEVLLIAPPAADIPRCRVNTCVWVDRCSHINHHGKHACGKTNKVCAPYRLRRAITITFPDHLLDRASQSGTACVRGAQACRGGALSAQSHHLPRPRSWERRSRSACACCRSVALHSAPTRCWRVSGM